MPCWPVITAGAGKRQRVRIDVQLQRDVHVLSGPEMSPRDSRTCAFSRTVPVVESTLLSTNASVPSSGAPDPSDAVAVTRSALAAPIVSLDIRELDSAAPQNRTRIG